MNPFLILPCIDSAQAADLNKNALDIPRDIAIQLGESALRVVEEGYYEVGGSRISIADLLRSAIQKTVSISPQTALPEPRARRASQTSIQVCNETTLVAAKRLFDRGANPLALNFANGVQPGGGFLHGSKAQEEVLCRSSGLHATLQAKGAEMYHSHQSNNHRFSSDWAILSPDVPVFRSDNGGFLEVPWPLSVVTCAAPFCNGLTDGIKQQAATLLRQRIARVLFIAKAHGYTSLVLGAWGCGAFGNDPFVTARNFRDVLYQDFAGCFDEVIFAITDWSPDRRFLGPFRDAFSEKNSIFGQDSGAVMQLLMNITFSDGSIRSSRLEFTGHQQALDVSDPVTGLGFQLRMDGFSLAAHDSYSDGLMLPLRITPPVWGLNADAPINQVFDQLKKCGREALYKLQPGDWLINNQGWIKCEFVHYRLDRRSE